MESTPADSNAKPGRGLRVTYVSRWGVQCGIATYTDQLCLAMAEHGARCNCAAEAKGIIPVATMCSETEYTRCWAGNSQSFMPLLLHIKENRPDVVHIQHEFGLMDQQATLEELLKGLGMMKIPVVVTCHTVMAPPHEKRWFFYNILRLVDAVVAHNEETKEALLRWNIDANKVAVIPHGTLEPAPKPEKGAARRQLYLPDDPNVVIALSLGFITKGKMQHQAVSAVTWLVREMLIDPRNFLYVIAGEPGQGTDDNKEYCRELHNIVRKERAWNYIHIAPRFIPASELPTWYSAADFVITGSHPTFFSTSGRAHQEMAFEMPSISARVALLSDLNEERSLKFSSEEELRSHIIRMSQDAQLRGVLARRCGEFAKDTSWSRVALRHIELYRSLGSK
jgi:glycosyltransferase involved in cell wall biosynthesis